MVPPQVIALINGFSGVSDDLVAQYAHAQGVQFARDVSPIWGICPGVTFTPGATTAPDGACPCWLADTLDVAGALGYHDEDAHGNPFIKVANVAGYDWRTTASHEALELKGDSPANIWAQADATTMIAYELCDPVEGDSYEVEGVPLSNFVLPAYFDPQAAPGSRLDFLGKLTKPLTMTPGGYMIVWTISGQPTQVFGAHVNEIWPGLHVHFGPNVSVEKRAGIVAKYRKSGRRAPRAGFVLGMGGAP